MTDYIIDSKTIIFDPRYNKPIDPKLLFQDHYEKIYFSNYKLNDELFEAYKYNYFEKCHYF